MSQILDRNRPACAIVLGAAVRPDGSPSPTLALRLRHAVTLYEEGVVDRICCTGGQGDHGPPEGRVAAELARHLGVPEAALLREEASRNTVENIALSLPLVGDGPIVIVSSRWHLPRAWLICRMVGVRASCSGPISTAPLSRVAVSSLKEIAATPVSVFRVLRWARRT